MVNDFVRNDSLLMAIDNAPRYQPIPAKLFKENYRKEYLDRRNKRLLRPDAGRDKLINLSGKTVLDIGCEIGYFGWNNAGKLKQYAGIDSDPTCIRAARKITKELGYTDLQFENIDLVEFIEGTTSHYDTCLFFSIYHHLLYQIGWKEAREVMNKISEVCDELYFDMGQKDEPTNSARHKWHNLLPDKPAKDFITEEVLHNSSFNHAFILGETKVGNSKRLLFRFNK